MASLQAHFLRRTKPKSSLWVLLSLLISQIFWGKKMRNTREMFKWMGLEHWHLITWDRRGWLEGGCQKTCGMSWNHSLKRIREQLQHASNLGHVWGAQHVCWWAWRQMSQSLMNILQLSASSFASSLVGAGPGLLCSWWVPIPCGGTQEKAHPSAVQLSIHCSSFTPPVPGERDLVSLQCYSCSRAGLLFSGHCGQAVWEASCVHQQLLGPETGPAHCFLSTQKNCWSGVLHECFFLIL